MSQMNLTEGSIYRRLLVFAVPYLLANLIQALYGAVDMAVVGWFANAAGISAVSVGSQVMQIVTSLVSGLTMGGTILIANYFGAGRREDTARTVSTMLTLFSLAAVAFTVMTALCAHPILKALKTPEEAYGQAYQYVIICTCGIVFIFGYNAVSAIMRGLGDSRSPLLFVSVACISNIVLDLALVGGLSMGAAGAALATAASQGISLVLAVAYLRRRDFLFDFKLKSFRLYGDKARALLRLGFPISLQECTVNLSFLIIAAIVNTLGVVPSAAVGIAGKFEGFAMLPASAFSSAIASMAAQNIGAGRPERARATLNAGVVSSLAAAVIFFAWAQAAPTSIMAIFRADPQVAMAGAEYLRAFSWDFLMVSFVFCMNGFLNGCGCTTFSMINGVLSTLVARVPFAFLLSRVMASSLFGVGLAAPLASFVSIVVGGIYIARGKWRGASLA